MYFAKFTSLNNKTITKESLTQMLAVVLHGNKLNGKGSTTTNGDSS